MSRKNNILKSFSALKFFSILKERKNRFASAASDTVPQSYPVNDYAKLLHPEVQYVKVSKVEEVGSDAKRFTLVPDLQKGTERLASFSSGQYISLQIDINGNIFTRAYSLCSSPKEVLEGFYQITVKNVNKGLCSTWILEHFQEGTEAKISAPLGTFDYNGLRDAPVVIGIAGGSGITPFLSMAKAIADGDEDFSLSLLYGNRTQNSIMFKKEFDELQKRSSKIKVIHVLSDEKIDGFENGFITAELVKKYAPDDSPYSVFLCGPQGMYNFMDKELEKLGLEKKWIRHEMFGEIHGAKLQSDFPGCENPEVKITLSKGGQRTTVTGSSDDTILQILEKNGLSIPARCRSGECGWCHSLLKSGQIYVPQKLDYRRKADYDFNFIHPCCTFALSDIEIEN